MSKYYQIYHEIPAGLLSLKPCELYAAYTKPLLIHLAASAPCENDWQKRPIFISTLLHGNETTGFLALQNFLQNCADLKRPLIIFIGNLKAAEHGLRHLPDQADYNRIWETGNTDDHAMSAEIYEYAKTHYIIAAVDIHNNTGKNPYYGCINKLENSFLNLASLFSEIGVYFTKPHEVLSNKFSNLCPSMTIECGLSGKSEGVEYAVHFLEKLMNESCRDNFLKSSYGPIKLYHSVARIKIPTAIRHTFDLTVTQANPLSFIKEIDQYNFKLIKKDTLIANYLNDESKFAVLDSKDQIATSEYFYFREGKVFAASDLIPSMLTKDIQVAKDDCLGYLMQVLELQ